MLAETTRPRLFGFLDTFVHKKKPERKTVFEQFPQLRTIPADKFPKTVLIIPDGNGRYADLKGLPTVEGHKEGAKALEKSVEMFVQLPSIKTLAVWGFSNDNWKRSKEEIDGIMEVMEATIRRNRPMLEKYQVRFVRMGAEDRIRNEYPTLWQTICQTEEATKDFTNKTLAVMVDFSGKDQEKRMIQKALKKYPDINPDDLTDEMIDALRDGQGLVAPADLVIRTSGEQRTSDIGWMGRNSEFYAIDAFLPNVAQKDFADALVDYSKRERRLGARPHHLRRSIARRLWNLPGNLKTIVDFRSRVPK